MQDGKTTKEQVFDKLGWPVGCFLENKILIYNLYGPSEKDVSKLGSQVGSNVYSLQLVFESSKLMDKKHKNNFLMRHSLVKTRSKRSKFSIFRFSYEPIDYSDPRDKSCMD